MAVERFYIQIAKDVLDDLKYRLDHIRWPDQLEDVAWERGTEKGYLQSLISYWREHYDWRAQEAELNRFSQFCCTVNGVNVHFVHERGKGPNPYLLSLPTDGRTVSYATRRLSRFLQILRGTAVIQMTLSM